MEDPRDFDTPYDEATATAFAIVREERSDGDVIHVFGEFAFGTSDEIESTLVQSVRIGRRTVCNLLGCTYLDVAGARVLFRAREALGPLFVLRIPENGIVTRLLELVGYPIETSGAAATA